MSKLVQVSHLIGEIYDAALDPDKWESVLERTCAFLQTMNASLVSFDPVQKCQFSKSWGYAPEFLQSYNDHYQHINPTIPGFVCAPGGAVLTFTSGSMIPYDELRRSKIWREWAAPQGYADGLQVNLDKHGMALAAFAASRHEEVGPYNGETLELIELLWPHFRRSVLIGKLIDLHKIEAAALADTLDGLSAALILIDANGRVTHTNSAARVLFDDTTVARNTGGKLTLLDARANAIVHDIAANAENAGGADNRGTAIPLASRDGKRYVAHVLPLTSGARRRAKIAYSAVAAIFLRKAELDAPHPIEAIANAFDLTPAELRVLMMIVQVGGVPEVAPILGITEPTVKTHLQHIYQKTETTRQADLVKLVASYMNPLE